MNSYFEQGGFYGHPHQSGMMSATSGQEHSSAAAYRGFPLSLGMSPYANPHLHQSRTAQDSPYDASITAACKQIYDGAYNKDCNAKSVAAATTNGTTANGANSGNNNSENGYKDVWNSSGSNGTPNSAPVRPSACTPDSRVGGYIDASGGSPVSRTGSSATGGGGWNGQCSVGGTQSASSASLHQNHTFYPWMAIAGECELTTFLIFTSTVVYVQIYCSVPDYVFTVPPPKKEERKFQRFFFLSTHSSYCVCYTLLL